MYPYKMNNWLKKVFSTKLYITDNANHSAKVNNKKMAESLFALIFTQSLCQPHLQQKQSPYNPCHKKEAPESAFIKMTTWNRNYFCSHYWLFHPKYILCLDLLENVTSAF